MTKQLNSANLCISSANPLFIPYQTIRQRIAIHDMTALLVRRARLGALHLATIRAGYKYLFIERGRIGKAKVKEGAYYSNASTGKSDSLR